MDDLEETLTFAYKADSVIPDKLTAPQRHLYESRGGAAPMIRKHQVSVPWSIPWSPWRSDNASDSLTASCIKWSPFLLFAGWCIARCTVVSQDISTVTSPSHKLCSSISFISFIMKLSATLVSVGLLVASATASPMPEPGKKQVNGKWKGASKWGEDGKWYAGGKQRYFTSTYSVKATPDQVVNGTEPTGGLPVSLTRCQLDQ